jgi:prepilin-type N-terminal cleavage/methylation domain-containing protein
VKRSKQDKGFTLAEVLMVVAILGLVIAGIYSFYFSGLRSWHKGVDRMDYQQSARIAMDKIVKELQFANQVTVGGGGTELRYSFVNDENNYVFKRVGPENEDLVLIYERGDGSSTQLKIALGITGLDFSIDARNYVRITVSAGAGAERVTLHSSVRPRNIP